ncbi:putative Metallophosphoesterase [Candidatus Sulfopaludibacter sp. SbA6]|nr:putative Metallophosphoesterase [Candidatus Sulfopaludibacter sp. SbA6]
MSFISIIEAIFAVTQLYWAWQARRWIVKHMRTARARILVGAGIAVLYFGMMAFNFHWFSMSPTPARLTLGQALLGAPFQWWAASSVVGFLVAMLFAIARLVARIGSAIGQRLVARKATALESPGRRQFLARTATLAVGSPFVAGSYGLLWGRLNLETTEKRIRLARLPKAFDGFRIAQLSDIHIGPFMPEQEIRKYVAIANALKPDMTVLTGDFVTWVGDPQEAVVSALSGLRAPFGVFGCLGNHDAWAKVEDSITALFREIGFRILRQEAVDIAIHGEAFHLMGIDFQSLRRFGPGGTRVVRRFLDGVEGLRSPDLVNILLSHNPDTFDRAAELGIELSLAGHTHGGQVALEFISPEIAPSRLVTPYVSGWFEKPGGQLYVNRGIGTIGVPIRIGAPPEITLFELTRG